MKDLSKRDYLFLLVIMETGRPGLLWGLSISKHLVSFLGPRTWLNFSLTRSLEEKRKRLEKGMYIPVKGMI